MSLDGYVGMSVISYMRESLSLALDSEAAASVLMKNGSFVDAVITHPAQMSPESYKRLKDSWAEKRSGVENTGKTAILEEGAKLEKMSMTANDLQFMAQRDFQRYDIAMFFGVPPHMIGATEKTTSWGSGIEQLNIGFVQYTLNDWFVTWQETIKRDLLMPKDQEKYDVRFFPQALLKGDLKTQWDAFTRGRQWGIYSANDVRAMLDLNPREDAEGNDYAVPPNQTKDDADAPQDDVPTDGQRADGA
jgi:HK97 family phage portal protein